MSGLIDVIIELLSALRLPGQALLVLGIIFALVGAIVIIAQAAGGTSGSAAFWGGAVSLIAGMALVAVWIWH